ncbi:hypothetical protein MTP10_41600 [Nonomuraea sp. 3-1Str]|uniref:hypothetical protein n=1 Tax=Nonomuraea sp. 3-1Str TaxID=2929801 RepID=UPI002863C6BF|nr:hypothetical protein [Nonomuraea sp. 3-1Str]MDR8415216.1 hypothetical protein [Nonomuraea sp. 3-1Str]
MTRVPRRAPADGAAAHLLARAGGPLPLGPGAAAPPGMLRLTRPDSTGQALPVWPDGVTPALLEEHQVAPVAVERSGETRRVLAACLKCCWTDQSVDPWPGDPAPVELVLATYRALIGRTDDLMRNWAVGALRRLHDSAWVVMADGLVTLGPRCALWPVSSLAQLKELVRRIPEPERQELTVGADADIVAAARATPASAPPDPATPVPTTDPGPSAHAGTGGDVAVGDAGEGGRAGAQAASPAAETAVSSAVVATASRASEAAVSSAAGARIVSPGVGGRVEGGEAEFDDLLGAYDERRRAELVAAFMVVEYAAEPVQEARFAALRDPALRHTLGEMLARRGRTLIQHRERWISGYADETAARAFRDLRGPGASPSLDGSAAARSVVQPGDPAEETPDAQPGTDAQPEAAAVGEGSAGASPVGGGPDGSASGDGTAGAGLVAPSGRSRGPRDPVRLGEAERAVLTLVLVHSVAIPRAEGVLPEDTWLSPHATPVEELRRHTQVPIGELEGALRVLRHAGLVAQVKAGEEAGGYVPGSQFHRLTPAARRRLQEELILAAGPHTPLATAVRARRSAG